MRGKLNTFTAEIASGQTTSGVINVFEQGQMSALIMPSAFTGSTVTFTGSMTPGGTFQTVYSDGADYSVTVEASKWVVLDPTVFYTTPYIKIVSGSSEGDDREITVVTSKVL